MGQAEKVWANPTNSTKSAQKTWGLNIGTMLLFPQGDYANIAGTGMGIHFRGTFPLTPEAKLSARLGFLHHLEEHHQYVEAVPFMMGLHYTIKPRFYITGEIGITFIDYRASELGITLESSDSAFGITAGGGFKLNKKMAIGGHLSISDLDNTADSTGFLFTFDYEIRRFFR